MIEITHAVFIFVVLGIVLSTGYIWRNGITENRRIKKVISGMAQGKYVMYPSSLRSVLVAHLNAYSVDEELRDSMTQDGEDMEAYLQLISCYSVKEKEEKI